MFHCDAPSHAASRVLPTRAEEIRAAPRAMPRAGNTRTTDAPLPAQRPRAPSSRSTRRIAATAASSRPTCSKMRARSSGAIVVFETQPAVPPAQAAQLPSPQRKVRGKPTAAELEVR